MQTSSFYIGPKLGEAETDLLLDWLRERKKKVVGVGHGLKLEEAWERGIGWAGAPHKQISPNSLL